MIENGSFWESVTEEILMEQITLIIDFNCGWQPSRYQIKIKLETFFEIFEQKMTNFSFESKILNDFWMKIRLEREYSSS